MKVNDDLVGTVLGNYTLEKMIGHSQFSTMYLARQFHPGRLVAVKVVQAQVPRRDDFFLRFRREVTNIARLDHPHILPLLDYEEHDQLAYMVMPYIGSGNLEQVLKREGKLAPQQILAYLLQIASALDYAHSLHAIHGDLRPTNVLINAEGRLMLTDFALAHLFESRADVDMEAALYMSPEMVRGEPLTHYSDIYQLGILLFQMLSGHLPFKGESTYALMRQHLRETIPSVAALTPDLPLTLDRVLQKATARYPSERYKSVGELAQAFAGAIAMMDRPRQSLAHHLHFPVSHVASDEPDNMEFVVAPVSPHLVAPPSRGQLQSVRATSDEAPRTADFGFSYTHEQVMPLPSTIARKPDLVRYFVLKCLPLFAMVGIVTLALLHILGAFATSSIPPSEQARLVVSLYYDDLNQHNYHAAYALCSPDFQRHTSYERFISSYQSLAHNDISFKQFIVRSPSEVDMLMQLQTQEKVPQGTLMHHYRWSGVIDRQPDGSWKIEQITLTIAPSPDYI
ncbi:serine/threonine protein kinase [Dictyobacter aurantiacus]|uniref:non-specific serine/threonine protein kinase n=1 Tax=Dictyobacter aurantiacus TaxID=1936993 RepID=A0A401ZAQ2_9CHLR|nr:serine/threonine-protein kinase [Dictyobacter aurantiacus]GCE03903.1 hypothetical protein KDAU_12320 [Dictyobacter aurantiacus]